MAWASTLVSQRVVADQRCHVYDCVYSGTGYGGGLSITGATAATGPTKTDLGFASTTDPEFNVTVQQVPRGVTGAFYVPVTREAAYDPYNEKLIVGATAATDISDTTYRLVAYGRYGR
jgi:hypothetical protein